jgi:ribosomal protein S18 acetylase RimI-like enzyme
MENYNVRIAESGEFEKVRAFYFDMIDKLETEKYGPGWKKDIYPAPNELKDALRRRELYVLEIGERLGAVMILNSNRGDGYEKLEAESGIKGEDALLIHALGVGFDFQRKGIAAAMVRHAISVAKEKGCLAVRLDVLSGNIPAENLYPKLGFEHMYTVNMFYEDTGWADYKIYQLLL